MVCYVISQDGQTAKKGLHFQRKCDTLYAVIAYLPMMIQYTIIQEFPFVVNAFLEIGNFFYAFFRIFKKFQKKAGNE